MYLVQWNVEISHNNVFHYIKFLLLCSNHSYSSWVNSLSVLRLQCSARLPRLSYLSEKLPFYQGELLKPNLCTSIFNAVNRKFYIEYINIYTYTHAYPDDPAPVNWKLVETGRYGLETLSQRLSWGAGTHEKSHVRWYLNRHSNRAPST